MESKPLSIGSILRERQRFVVPIYQRTYSWTVKKQLEAFIEQIKSKASERLDGNRSAFSHYMGALLVIPEGEAVFGRIQTFNVVDGQQRLTTFHLFYAALRELAQTLGLNGIAHQIRDLLVHSDETPMHDRANERYKLQPTKYDRQLVRDLIDDDRTSIRSKYPDFFYQKGTLRESDAPLPLRAWWFFRDTTEEFVTEGDADAAEQEKRVLALSTALFEDFRLIVITLAKDDDAQVIFQTLNTGGEPLAAMDLVRNDVFHRASRRGEDVDRLMEERWSVFEQPFWKQNDTQGRITKPRIDFFLAHSLTAEQGKDVSLSELYAEYKNFVTAKNFASAAEELKSLTCYVPTYRLLVEPSGQSSLARLAQRLSVFDVSTAYPLVFVIAASQASTEDKNRSYELIASYIIRRALCGLTPKNYNKVFARLAGILSSKGVSATNLSHELAILDGDTVRFPTDADLLGAIENSRQYGAMRQNRLRLILQELELASRDKFDETAGIRDDLQIEHVMPDEWTEFWPLSDERFAPRDLETGVDGTMRAAIQGREALKHTLGNLSLLTPAANPQIGKLGFEKKRERLRGSLLKLNQEIASEPEWNEAAIKRRAIRLAKIAISLWPPALASASPPTGQG
jgi:Protein of unknown function DUF262/Protein of unknown function (DUF1524)